MKILIIRLSSLGDLVLTTPVYQNLREIFPEAEINLLVKEEFLPLFENNPLINEIIPYRKEKGLLFYIREVRRRKYDLVIDLHNNLRSNFIRFLSGAKKKIKYNKAIRARYLLVYKKKYLNGLDKHTLERYLNVLEQLVVKPGLKILVVQTAYLGDAVLTLPLIFALKDNFPGSSVSILCTPEIKEVFAPLFRTEELMIYDKRKQERGLLNFLALVKKVKEKRFDFAILPHRSFRSALLVRLAGIPRRIGFKSSEGKLFLTDLVDFDWRTHDSRRNLGLLEPLGVEKADISKEFSLNVDYEIVRNFLREHNLNENELLIGINPGSVWPTKRWLPERFAEVINRLIEEDGIRIVIFGGKEDADSIALMREKIHNPVIDLTGKTNLKQLISIISLCRAFITNDSGPMHIAVALKVPTVAIFGPTTKELGFFPYGEMHQVVEVELPCRPCSLHGGKKCPLKHFNCMQMISADIVYQKVKEVMPRRNLVK